MKLLFLGRPPEPRWRALQTAFPGVRFAQASAAPDQEREIATADATFGWPSRTLLQSAARLRWVHVGSAGIEHIETLADLAVRGVTLTNARGAQAPSVADHTFGLMLSFTRRLREIAADQAAHRWARSERVEQMRELTGATLAIVGMGHIGRAVARRAAGFEMRVLGVDRRPQPVDVAIEACWGLDRLDDALTLADHLVVTVPLTRDTRHLIDRRRLGLTKQGAHVFVVSRGGIVDEAALVEALESGHLGGAALDSTETEPLPADSPLWSVPNLIVSPHCAGSSPRVRERGWELLHENLRRFVADVPLLNVCDPGAGF